MTPPDTKSAGQSSAKIYQTPVAEKVQKECFYETNLEDFEVAPVNLTWLVMFTLFICSTSIIVDDLFFKHQNRLVSRICGFGWCDSDDSPSEDLVQETNVDILQFRFNPSYDALDNDMKSDVFDVIITTRSIQQKHAIVHGSAICLMLGVIAIWGISAYIAITYNRSERRARQFYPTKPVAGSV